MLCGCIVTKLKSTFDSLVCEFTAKAGEGGIVSRCKCNIFTIGNRFTGSFKLVQTKYTVCHIRSVIPALCRLLELMYTRKSFSQSLQNILVLVSRANTRLFL